MAESNPTTTSSQSRVIRNDGCFSEALNKSKSPKPALLPKPKISAADLQIAKAQIISKTQSSSQTEFVVKKYVQNADKLNGQGIISTPKRDSNDFIVTSPVNNVHPSKPANISPKPQLPPKSNVFKSNKSIFHLKTTVSSTISQKPEILPKKFTLSDTPVRPPRSPKRTFKNNPLDDFENNRVPKDQNWEVHKQKSASLARNENFNWTAKELNKASKTPIRYYQQITKKNTEKPFEVRKDPPTPRPRVRNKSKLHFELDLATNVLSDNSPSPSVESSCPIYAAVDYSKKKNRRIYMEECKTEVFVTSQESYHLNEGSDTRSSDSTESFKSLVDLQEMAVQKNDATEKEKEKKNDDVNDVSFNNNNDIRNNNSTYNGVNDDKFPEGNLNDLENEDYFTSKNNNRELVNNIMNENRTDSYEVCHIEEIHSVQRQKNEVPSSFVHRTASERKHESTEEDKKEETVQPESFLHKNKTQQPISSEESFDSFEFVSVTEVQNDGESTPKITLDNCRTVSPNSSTDRSSLLTDLSQSPSVIAHQNSLNDSKSSSESLSRPSSSDFESSSVIKRFPWFGSFGKGHKKQAEKKERCASQFYTSPTNMGSDGDLSERSRAISLPNIQNSGSRSDRTMNREDSNWSNSVAESISSGYSGNANNSDSDDDKDSLQRAEIAQDEDSKKNKAFLIANELMTSEEVFIDVLKLLNVHFRNYIKDCNFKNNEVVSKILNHLPEFQSLNEDLLDDMKKRIENWESNPKIADVIVKKGAFLKMYAEYIKNFENQMKYFDECVAKYPKFGAIVREFESLGKCKKLTVKHYMLKPVQRIPQYRLLLDDYLKHIDESFPDYEDTLTALKIVSEVADHANRSIKSGDENGRLMHFQSLLSDFELIKPGRELIKDGPLEKLCRKTIKERYFILLNDCLLHTTYSKTYLKIHQDLPLSGMKVCCNEEDKYPHSFTVYSITKSFILCAKSESERMDWVEKLQKTIEAYISRQKTFMNVKLPETDSLGKKAPVWIQDSKVTMCQICTAEFTALFRRHHCRACGKVVCGKCGSNQAPLQYRDFKPDKVCDLCFEILLKDYEDSEHSIYELLKEKLGSDSESTHNTYLDIKSKFVKSSAANSWKKQKFIPPRLKEVSANDSDSDISGWLYRKSKKSWKVFWYVLKDHVLYVYRASQDILALETIPVLGYQVKNGYEASFDEVDKGVLFSLWHPPQSPIIFRAETEELAEKWITALTTATNFEEL